MNGRGFGPDRHALPQPHGRSVLRTAVSDRAGDRANKKTEHNLPSGKLLHRSRSGVYFDTFGSIASR